AGGVLAPQVHRERRFLAWCPSPQRSACLCVDGTLLSHGQRSKLLSTRRPLRGVRDDTPGAAGRRHDRTERDLNSRDMKRAAVALIAAAILDLGLAGCGGSDSTDATA